MKIRSICSFLLIIALVTLYPGGSRASTREIIRINGSGSALEMMKPLIEAYGKQTPGVSFIMEKPLGSSGAIKALLAGALDIVASSKPLKPEEAARGAKLVPYGKTPLAIVAQNAVPARNLSTEELEAIYSGKKTKWDNGEKIRPILRPRGDIDTKILTGLSPRMGEAMENARKRPGMLLGVTDPEANEAVAQTKGGIGASGLTALLNSREPLRVVALNGVLPSPGTLANGTYPLAKEISFITTANTSKAAVKFLEFVYSRGGRAIAEKTGVLITIGQQ